MWLFRVTIFTHFRFCGNALPPTFDDMNFEQFSSIVLEHAGLLDEDGMELGHVEIQDLGESIAHCLKLWCKEVDEQLNQVMYGSQLYLQLMEIRLFTFEEYQFLFNDALDETVFPHFRVFEFLMIDTSQKLARFISGRTPDMSSYVNVLHLFPTRITDFIRRRTLGRIMLKGVHGVLNGGTGSGKSELLKSIFYQRIKQSEKKRNACPILIDPHGKLAKEVIHLKQNEKRILYFDPCYNDAYAIVFNIFELHNPSPWKIDVFSQIIARVFEETIPQTVSGNMEAMLVPCISTLLYKGDSGLPELQRFMDDKNNQDLVELGLKSPIPQHRAFFKNFFNNSNFKQTKHAIMVRLQKLLNSPTFYKLVAGKSTVNLEKEINAGKVIVFNLAKGVMGDDAAIMFGKLLIGYIQGIAMMRAREPNKHFIPIYLDVDEFHNYVSPSLGTILTETRKYGLFLFVAHQSLEQLPNNLKRIIMSNAKIKIFGSNSNYEHRELAKEMNVSQEKMAALKDYHFYVRKGKKDAFMIKSSDVLLNKKGYLMDRSQQDKLKHHLLVKSGYYRKVGESKPDIKNESTKEKQEQQNQEILYTPKLTLN